MSNNANEPATSVTTVDKNIELLDDAFRAILLPGSAVRPIAEGFTFTEGPAWFDQGQYLLFSDIPGDTIFRWKEGEGHAVWRRPSHNSNGNTVDLQGRLLTCEHGSRTLTRTASDGAVSTLAAAYEGRRINSPNDVVVKRDGTVWFTDPPYGINPKTSEQPANCVFRLDRDGAEPVMVIDDFSRPNGLCFSPDESQLYIADSDTKIHHIRRFRVNSDNTIQGGEVFATVDPGLPDGIRVDVDGRLYSTSADGVHVFSPAGKLLGKIHTPETAANCQFGGKDHRTLFITATRTVWAVNLAVKGAR